MRKLTKAEKLKLSRRSLEGIKYLVEIARKTNEMLIKEGLDPIQIGVVLHIMEKANTFSMYEGATGSIKKLIDESEVDIKELVDKLRKEMDEMEQKDVSDLFGG